MSIAIRLSTSASSAANHRKFGLWAVLCVACLGLIACRGGDDAGQDTPRFPQTPDPDAFDAFLNPAPGVPRDGVPEGEIDNLEDFPEAYYNTIDPNGSRDTLIKWRTENGFLDADGTQAECLPSDCVQAHVKFRDTRDQGYGRDLFMRRDLSTGDIALYVENYQVDAVPGVPYGPLNLDALVENDRTWNFAVNAIEFSSFPDTSPGALKFTKFYNFAGDGIRALLASGSRQHFVDPANRGLKPMPQACVTCHGGHGRTLVYEDSDATKKLAPTIVGGIPGDLQGQLQSIELDTLQFAEAPGFTRADNEEGIRLINEAVRDSYVYRDTFFNRPGDWDPTLAIEMLEGRYGGNPADPAQAYDPTYVPAGLAAGDADLYRTIVGPNCQVCHVLQGSRLGTGVNFSTVETIRQRGVRIDELIFARGLMPLGLLNYWNFWDSGTKEPGDLAVAIDRPDRLDANGRAIHPGGAVAHVAAPLLATGFDSVSGAQFDIPLSASGSAFVADSAYRWSVEPAATAQILASAERAGEAALRATVSGEYTVSLEVVGNDGSEDSTTITVDVRDAAQEGSPPPTGETTFYGANGILALMDERSCLGCHSSQSPFVGIPLLYEPCRSDVIDGYDFMYRSVLARVNFSAPHDSLFLRNGINGATDVNDLEGSGIEGYHAGGGPFADPVAYSQVLGWILEGAPRGDLPTTPIPATAPDCTG